MSLSENLIIFQYGLDVFPGGDNVLYVCTLMYVLIYVTGIGVCIHAYTKIGSKSMFMQVHVHVRMHTCICVNDPSQGCIPAWIDRTELRGW